MSGTVPFPKIAFYCSSISWGGLEMNTIRYAQAFQSENYAVKVYAVEGSSLFNSAADLQIPLLAVPRNKKYFDLRAAKKLARQFSNDEIDVVHFRDNRDLDFLGWVKYFSTRKLKLVYHQAMQLGVVKKDFLHSFRFNRVDAWVATLDYMKKQVLSHTKFSASKLHVIPLGTSIDQASILSKSDARKQFDLPQDKFLLGVVGRLDEKKGQLEMIEALPLLAESGKDFLLVLVGDKTKNEALDYENALKDKVAELGLESQVVFLPHQKNMQQLYGAFDLVAVPSWEETFGTVTIEAMASGIPIVGSNTAGTAEILKEEQFLFSPKNPTEIASVLLETMTNDSLREKWGITLQNKFQEKYSMEASLREWKELLIFKI